MSKAEKQTITLLSIVSGSLATIYDFNLDPSNKPSILYTRECVNAAIQVYPCSDSHNKLLNYVKDKVTQYDVKLKELKNMQYSTILLITMCDLVLTDLSSKIKDKKKLELIEPVAEAISILHNRLDPKGNMFDVYSEADELIKFIYDIVEF